MGKPKVVGPEEKAEQLKLDFGDRHSERENKLADKAVVMLIDACVLLGLDQFATNEVLNTVGNHNPIIEAHTEK